MSASAPQYPSPDSPLYTRAFLLLCLSHALLAREF